MSVISGCKWARTFEWIWIVAWIIASIWQRNAEAQYGFGTPAYATQTAYAWGNPYVSSAAQLPAWGQTAVPPTTSFWQGWQLGAIIQNTSNGVLILQVQPSSVAERSGLRAGDVILSVGGTQVGYVNGRINDVILEANRHVGAYGRVPMLVLDSYSRQPKTLELDLTNSLITSSGTVSGRIFIDGLFMNYGNGVIKVEITNLTRPYLSASGGVTYVPAFGNGPFNYQIFCDSRFASPQDRNRITATLYDVSQRILATSSADINSPVLGTKNIDLRLQSSAVQPAAYTTSYGNYFLGQDVVYEAFRKYVHRNPSASESQAWQQQLAAGAMSIDEMKAQIISGPAFYDRAGNNPERFIQLMLESAGSGPAAPDQLLYWRNRYSELNGDRLQLAREFVPGRG